MLKICRLLIKGYRQFEDTNIDFTDPATGEPADRICLIGRNGTGKSTVLQLLDVLLNRHAPQKTGIVASQTAILALKVKSDNRSFYFFPAPDGQDRFIDGAIDEIAGWDQQLGGKEPAGVAIERLAQAYPEYVLQGDDEAEAAEARELRDNALDLLIYSPAESPDNHGLSIWDVPNTTVSTALALRSNIAFRHEVSTAHISLMWTHLVFLLKQREEARERFERLPENLDKTKRELIEAFDRDHPNALRGIGSLWNRILEPAGLVFDVEGAQNPIQLTDNLLAYIRLRSSGEHIPYAQLSTGIRNFLFRVGHIYLLYFNRAIERGFVLIDEPENSLFPDFLFELVKTYDDIVRQTETQLFFATHNPIVAAQFAPYERIVLEWDGEGQVRAKKGTAPKGDDPNDLLEKDFELVHLMGEEGQRMWQEYLALRQKLRRSRDEEEKAELIARAADIGRRYSFLKEEE